MMRQAQMPHFSCRLLLRDHLWHHFNYVAEGPRDFFFPHGFLGVCLVFFVLGLFCFGSPNKIMSFMFFVKNHKNHHHLNWPLVGKWGYTDLYHGFWMEMKLHSFPTIRANQSLSLSNSKWQRCTAKERCQCSMPCQGHRGFDDLIKTTGNMLKLQISQQVDEWIHICGGWAKPIWGILLQ